METEMLIAAIVSTVIAALNTRPVAWATQWINKKLVVEPLVVNILILPAMTGLTQALVWATGQFEMSPIFMALAVPVTSYLHQILKSAGVVDPTLPKTVRR